MWTHHKRASNAVTNAVAGRNMTFAELQRVQAVSTHFRGFDESEVRRLAAAMSVVEFKEGEKIIEKGEEASWFGILLRGTMRAVISEDVSFPIARGEFLGEQAVFESSIRSASVVAATDGILGSFTYDELEAFVEKEPTIGLRLVNALGRASADKLDAEIAGAIESTAASPSWLALQPAAHQLRQLTVVAATDACALGPLSIQECKTLFHYAKVVPFKEGQTILKAGQEVPYAAMVLQGEVEVGSSKRAGVHQGGLLCERRLFTDSTLAQPEEVVGVSAGSLLTFSRNAMLSPETGSPPRGPNPRLPALFSPLTLLSPALSLRTHHTGGTPLLSPLTSRLP